MRQYFVVSYDISEPKRWRSVYKIMKSYGEHVQYSVFICQLTDIQEMELRVKLDQVIHQQQDQVMFIQIGPVTRDQLDRKITTIGKEYLPRDLSKLIY